MDILLDTNFLVACVKYKVDSPSLLERQFQQVRFLILGRVLEEVGALPVKERKMAEAFLRGVPHRVVASKGPTDRDLLEAAVLRKAAVATLDTELKRRLKKAKIQVISLSKGRIVFS